MEPIFFCYWRNLPKKSQLPRGSQGDDFAMRIGSEVQRSRFRIGKENPGRIRDPATDIIFIRGRDGPLAVSVWRCIALGPHKVSGDMILDTIRMHLVIEGRVQGVWFRESTRREAVALKLTGWVKNRSDGTVEALIEGPEHEVNRLVSWCRKGPPAARVSGIRKRQETWQGEFDSFDVIF